MPEGTDPSSERAQASALEHGYRQEMPPGGWYAPPPTPTLAPLAGWWQRAGATALDSLVLLVPVLGLSLLFFFVLVSPLAFSEALSGAEQAVAILVAVILYTILLLVAVIAVNMLYAGLTMRRPGARNGQTLGKQALGIRVVRMSGDPQTFWSATLREVAIKTLIFGGAGGFLFGIPTLLDYLWPLWDDQRRALHDMLAGTRVVVA